MSPAFDAAFAMVARLGRPAMAWEVLRRDPAYRNAYRRLSAPVRRGELADADFVARWGMHFR